MYISKKECTNINETERKQINDEFIKNGLIKYKDYFDNMYKGIDDNVLLDEEQRIAILADEDYNMIIAGAGSGKTTTITAKIKYLVDIRNIEPKDIVVISFTNKAVDELKQRINIVFKIDCLITTFHKFGLMLLNNKKYKIIDDCYDVVKDYFEIILNDNKLLRLFNKQFKEYFKIPFISLYFKNFNNYYNFIKKIKFKVKPKDYYYKDFIHFCIIFYINHEHYRFYPCFV